MTIENTITNTKPLMAHAQGLVHQTDKWLKIVEELPVIDKNTLSNDITIVSFFSKELEDKMVLALKLQLDKSEIKYVNATNPQPMVWKNTMKIKYLSKLEGITTKYILCLDGLDILMCEDLSEIIQRYKNFNCDLLYNPSKLNYPPICTDIELTDSEFKYLNAGAFIGRTEFIRNFYQFLMKHEMYKDYGSFDNSEQVRVRNGRKNYKFRDKIKVDTDCILFQTLNKSQFTYDNNTLKIHY